MKVINETSGKEAEAIADALTKILSKENDPTYLNYPLVFIETYFKDGSGNMQLHQMYCMLKQPAEISSLKDKKIYLPTIRNEMYHKMGAAPWKKSRGGLEIPTNTSLIDMEKLIENEEKTIVPKLDLFKGENVFRMYVGNIAYTRFDKECKSTKPE